MVIIGVDFHPEFQEIASVNTDTGAYQEKRLVHLEEAWLVCQLLYPGAHRNGQAPKLRIVGHHHYSAVHLS